MPSSSGKPPTEKSRSSGSKSHKSNEQNSVTNDRGKADRFEGNEKRSSQSKNQIDDWKEQKSEEKRKSNSELRRRDDSGRKEGKDGKVNEGVGERRREKSGRSELGEGDVQVPNKESNDANIDKKRKHEETTEERAERKAREKKEKEKSWAGELDDRKIRQQRETSEERRERKKRERSDTGGGHRETSEERKERRRREKAQTGGYRETSEERRERKRRERAETRGGHRETSEERRERKRRERTEAGSHRETSEERRERKRREKKQKETSAERRENEKSVDEAKKNKEVDDSRKSKRADETPEERHERKKRERAERKAKEEENEKRAEIILDNTNRKHLDDEKITKRDETAEERAERKKREKHQREEEKARKAVEVSKNDYNEKADEEAGDDCNGYDDDDFEEYNYDEDFEDEGSNDVIDENDGEFADEVNSSEKHPMASKILRDEPKPVKDFYSKLEVVSYTFDISKSKKIWLLEKMKRRSLALLNRIELEHFSTDLFMLNPLSEYDMFMRKFGYSDTAQAVSQTREDDCEVEVQTEPPDLKESWTQHPPANVLKVSETISLSEQFVEISDNVSTVVSSNSSEIAHVEDTRKLNRFLMKSGGVMSSLLGSRETIGQSGKAKSYFEIADTFSNLIISQNPLLANSQVVNMSCNDFKVIVCLRYTKDAGKEKGLICVYSNVSFKEPSNYLVCSSELSSCSLTTNPSNPVVVGGAVDGTLYMWDLDISAEHVTKTVERSGKEFTLIFETFSTALSLRLTSAENTHKSPIVQLVCLENEPTGSGAMSKFQIASLDETGSLLFWCYHSSDNENELTLLPGGQTKFSFSHCYNFLEYLSQNRMYKSSKLEFQNVNAIEFLLNKPSNAFFATSNGAIVLCDCFNSESSIKLFKSNTSCEIVCLQICPVETIDVFVTCSQDGVVSLFNFSDPQSLLSLTSTACHSSFIQCLWHPSFPLLVFLLTSDAILVLDVTKFTSGSMFECKLRDYASKPIAIRMWNDVVTKRFVLAVAYESGDFEFHDILPDFMKNQSPQYQSKKLRKFISNQLILPPQKV